MNENIDLTKILKNCPKETKFYSSIYGELYYSHMYVNSSASTIYFRHSTIRSLTEDKFITICYFRDGRLHVNQGECTIFPSKDQRDWNKFSAPWYKKEKFDPKTLIPFDRVIVRNIQNNIWHIQLFSHIEEKHTQYPFFCLCDSYAYCIPYNDETKHLVGTTEKAPEYYCYWEK